MPSYCEAMGPSAAGQMPLHGVRELPTVFDEGEGDMSSCSLRLDLRLHDEDSKRDNQDQDQQDAQDQDHDVDDDENSSRSTSMVHKRKRGAQHGKDQIIQQQQLEIARLRKKQEELTSIAASKEVRWRGVPHGGIAPGQ